MCRRIAQGTERLETDQADKKRRPARDDALPEFAVYHDDGCEVSPSCLSCPLQVCRYDVPGGLKTITSEKRSEEILFLAGQGKGIEAIAVQVNVSRRSVFRTLKKSRTSQEPPGPGGSV